MNFLKTSIGIFGKTAGWFFRTSWKKRIVIILVILVAGFFLGREIFSKKGDGYIFDTVQKRTVTEIVSESGTVVTNDSVNIYSPTNGVIEKILVSNNEETKEGQILFTVKSTATREEKASAFAAYKTAEATLQQAENTLRDKVAIRTKILDDVKDHSKDESFTQRQTRTTAEVAADNAYDAVKAAGAALTSAQVAYQATQNAKVTAPVVGIVSNLSVASGSSITVNSLLTPSSPVLMIDGPGATEVMVSVGEGDINKIKINQAVDIEADAVSDKVYQGVVKRFDENGTVTESIVKFNVYIEVGSPDDKLKPGMTADVDIITNKLEGVLSVPNTAIKPYQKGRAVRKLGSNGELEFIPVKIGIRGEEFTQITEGLGEGQQIIVSLANEKVERKSPFGF
ncbi:efflux RND transporter periplasmic adaptor subunit [Patescibacteria group bacterium]|nr:efflux RND transporter periplasmic adaptor subunit [Patescibacteria group bacterium]